MFVAVKCSEVCYFCEIQLEEDEAKDSFDVDVAVTNPEKVGQCFVISVTHSFQTKSLLILTFTLSPMFYVAPGDGMNAYVAYKVSTRVCNRTCVHTYFYSALHSYY